MFVSFPFALAYNFDYVIPTVGFLLARDMCHVSREFTLKAATDATCHAAYYARLHAYCINALHVRFTAAVWAATIIMHAL